MPLPHEELKSSLTDLTGFEILSDDVKPSRVQLFGRVREQHVQAWLAVSRSLLLAARDAAWSVDISRQYFLRGEKMFFGWRLILQGPNMQEALSGANLVVQKTQMPAPAQAMEETVALNVAPNRNAMRNGRGVSSAGSVPLALATASQRIGERG